MNCNKGTYWDMTLPLENRVSDLVGKMTLQEKIRLLPTDEGAIERLGIEAYGVGGEAAHGYVSRIPGEFSTVFTLPIGLSSTWDPQLLKKVGDVIGKEARIYYDRHARRGGLSLWAPTIDMERDPRWGRTEEAYGEDPYLTGKLAAGLISGMQGEDPFYLQMVAAPKHFYANNHEHQRCFDSSSVDERNRKEYYLKAFETAFVEGKALSMMTAYNEINGVPAIEHSDILAVVKGDWNMQGYVVCDGGDFSQNVTHHEYYKTHEETLAAALKAGVDCLTDEKEIVIEAAQKALDKGLITEAQIDHAISNILRVRFRLGQFDQEADQEAVQESLQEAVQETFHVVDQELPVNPYAHVDPSLLCSKAHKAVAREVAQKAVVLLKNEENCLPLNEQKLKSLAVIGPVADAFHRDWYAGQTNEAVTVLKGIQERVPSVLTHSGLDLIQLKSTKENGYLSFDEDEIGAISKVGTVFERTDWGNNNNTLKSMTTGHYVNTNDGIRANSNEVYGWFVKEIIQMMPEGKKHKLEQVTLQAYDGQPIGLNAHHRMTLLDQDQNHACPFQVEVQNSGIAEAVKIAKSVETVIVCVGNHPLINGKEEIDRVNLELPPAQSELIKAVYAANKNLILVVLSGYPYALNWEQENLPAIVYTAPGSQELGHAVADVLFGDVNPAGRLSMTWYKGIDQLPPIKDYDIIKGKRTYQYFDGEPLYAFGYGLSYNDFEYKDIRLSRMSIRSEDDITVEVVVKNRSHKEGEEVVQVYTKALQSCVKRPFRILQGFKRVHFKALEEKTISFKLGKDAFTYWDVVTQKFFLESGIFAIEVGGSSDDLPLVERIVVMGENGRARELSKGISPTAYNEYEHIRIHSDWMKQPCVEAVKDHAWVCYDHIFVNESVTKFQLEAMTLEAQHQLEVHLLKMNHCHWQENLCEDTLLGYVPLDQSAHQRHKMLTTYQLPLQIEKSGMFMLVIKLPKGACIGRFSCE